jgi:hypothetical protein
VTELPSSFGFTAEQLEEAIGGTWADTTAGVALTLAPGAIVSYTLAGTDTGCMTMAWVDVSGTIASTNSGKSATVGGNFYGVTGLATGWMNLSPDLPCTFDYKAGVGTQAATLTATICSLSAINLGTFTLNLTK